MSTVAVVILNYNGLSLLQAFLPSVLQHSPEAEVWAVDNGSSDGSPEWLKQQAGIRTLCFDENYGFAEGYNKALREISATYYVLLNSDVEVAAGWLPPLVDFLEKHPEVGAAQPKILAQRQKTHFEYAGAAGGFLDTLAVPFCRGRIFDEVEEDLGQYDEPLQVFWATGACLFICAESYHKVGGLDGDFFAHMEEIDLCWRLQNAGQEVWAVPQSTVYHVGGATLQQGSPFKVYLNFRNGLLMMYKNLHPSERFAKIFFRLLQDGAAGVQFILKGQFKSCFAIIRAHFGFYKRAKKMAAKRKAFVAVCPPKHKLRDLPSFSGNVIWAFFVRRKKTFRRLFS